MHTRSASPWRRALAFSLMFACKSRILRKEGEEAMNPKVWIPLSLALLASLACSFLGGVPELPLSELEDVATQVSGVVDELGEAVEEQIQDEIEEQLDQVVGGDEEAPEEESSLGVEPDALSELDSYRTRMRTTWTTSEGTSEEFVMEREYTADPLAQRMAVVGEGGNVEFVQIGTTAWSCFADACVQVQQDAADFEDSFAGSSLEPEAFTSDSNAEFEGNEEVNGVNAKHYSVDPKMVLSALLARADISDLQAEVWISDESSLPTFVVRYLLSWNEKREEVEGTVEYNYEVYDVNEPITIEPPEGAPEGAAEDVPMYEGASEVMTTGPMTMFSTTDDVATVAAFYNTELPANGWTSTGETDMGEAVQQTWSKDDRSLQIMITSDDGETSVMIQEQ
jgi:hypothetical protein